MVRFQRTGGVGSLWLQLAGWGGNADTVTEGQAVEVDSGFRTRRESEWSATHSQRSAKRTGLDNIRYKHLDHTGHDRGEVVRNVLIVEVLVELAVSPAP